MSPPTNIAFKEWAVVVAALGSGRQSLILRKGGISEERGQFRLEHSQFWLFPTRYHESAESVVPESRENLRVLAANPPTDIVPIQYLARVEAVTLITDISLLKPLQQHHIWSQQVLEQRFGFGREPGLHAILVRVWQLPAAVPVALLPAYGGCKSWVELAQPIDGPLSPVLEEDQFARERQQFDQILGCSHACSHP
jgi:hypothetical protein